MICKIHNCQCTPASEVASPSMSQNTWVNYHYVQSVLHGAELILNELNILKNTYPGGNLRKNMLLGGYFLLCLFIWTYV